MHHLGIGGDMFRVVACGGVDAHRWLARQRFSRREGVFSLASTASPRYRPPRRDASEMYFFPTPRFGNAASDARGRQSWVLQSTARSHVDSFEGGA